MAKNENTTLLYMLSLNSILFILINKKIVL